MAIRASKNDTVSVSAEFLAGLKKANNGGSLYSTSSPRQDVRDR